MNVFDNFHVYLWRGNDNNCNPCLFESVLNEGRHLVVDPGHVMTPSYREPGLERLAQEMKHDGVDYDRIGLVILTHGHPDHCEAAVSIQKETHALIAMHRADEEMLQILGGRVDIYLQDGMMETVSGRQYDLQILHSPGHSPGHITVYWPYRKVLIAGDCIFYRSTGRTDFPGGSSNMLRESIERLARLDIEYLLCGHPYGHPGFIQGADDVRENFEIIMSYY